MTSAEHGTCRAFTPITRRCSGHEADDRCGSGLDGSREDLELALACDLRVAAEDAKLGMMEVRRGRLGGAGGTQRLPRLIGTARALEICLTGEPINAAEAYRVGLVNHAAVPADRLMSTAEELAGEKICLGAPLSLIAIKEAITKGVELPLQEGLKLESELAMLLSNTEDQKEGSRAFAEKRPRNGKVVSTEIASGVSSEGATMNPKGACAIVGVGETAVGKLPDMTTLGVQLEAIGRALKDAGLGPKQVDGLLAIQPGNDPQRSYALTIAQAARIHPTYATDLAIGGATPAAMVAHSVMAIMTGLCSTVVCVLGHKQATGRLEPRHGNLRDGNEDLKSPLVCWERQPFTLRWRLVTCTNSAQRASSLRLSQ